MEETNVEVVERFLICQWAYGWSDLETHNMIKKFFSERSWEQFFERKEEERKTLDNLMFELKNNRFFDNTWNIVLPNMEYKNRTYGNKYIKRKNRY